MCRIRTHPILSDKVFNLHSEYTRAHTYIYEYVCDDRDVKFKRVTLTNKYSIYLILYIFASDFSPLNTF